MKLFGTPSFTLNGTAVTADTRKATALVAYLAVEGSTGRDVLAGLLWPESPDSHARATLRRTLSAVRSALGVGTVIADRNQVALNDVVRVDLAVFDSAVAASEGHDHGHAGVCKECIPLLQTAVDMSRGGFLAGFSLRDAPDFDDWARQTAESLRLRCERTCERLSVAYAAEGDYPSAIGAANRWLELDRLREPAWRQLMLLHAWAGDRAAATEAYRRCLTTLNRELGVDPLPETTELHEAILDDDLPPAPGVRRRVAVQHAAEPALPPNLIDREVELAALYQVVRDRVSGAFMRLVGEAWMGKTRLLDETRAFAQALSRPVLLGRGYRAERRLPYGVVSQLLAELATLAEWDAIRAVVPDWVRREASRINPDLGSEPAPISRDALAGTRMHDALFRLLTAEPAVVLIDDAHFVDRSSLSVLTYMANRIATTRSVLIIAHRPDEERTLAPLIEATPTTASCIRLEPITANQIPRAGDLADSMIARTGGIPALVAEAFLAGESEEPTPGVRRFMDARLADLDDLTRQILSAAAVLSGSSDLDLLRETSGRSEDEVTAAAESLVSKNLLVSAAGAEGEFEFRLEGMKYLIYEEMSMIRRRLLHRRAAAALRTRPRASTDGVLAAAIAQHHRQGGQDVLAASWYFKAGQLAREVFAPTEALDAFQAALAMGHPHEAQIHTAMGETLLFVGRFSDSLTEFEKAAALSVSPTDQAVAEHRIGEASRRLGRLDVAIDRFAAAQAHHPDPVSLHCDWAMALLRLGDRKAAREQADRAVVASERSNRAGRSRALAVLGIVSAHRAEAHKALQSALDLAGAEPILRMAALNALGYSYAASGDDDEARRLIEEALEIAATVGDRHRQAALYNHLADVHHRAGRVAESEAALKEAVKLFVEVEPGAWEPEVWLLTLW